jgi:hypothetical protein
MPCENCNCETSKKVPLLHMKPVIYTHKSDFKDEEYEAAKEYFDIVWQRTEIPPHRLVIPRYTALPFNHELCVDIRNMRGRVINNSLQHGYVANLKNWVGSFGVITPQTWFDMMDIPADNDGPFVLKGTTNSRKERWSDMMYAKDRLAAVKVLLNLQADGLTGPQGVVIRQFEKLKNYGNDPISGIPITHEFRVFVAYGEVLASGFYWQNHLDLFPEEKPPAFDCPDIFIQSAIDRIDDSCNFYALDVAKKEDGNWIVVELNDGQMSGLSCVDPVKLYSKLALVIAKRDSQPCGT